MLPVVPVFSNKALVPLLVIAAIWAAVALHRGGVAPFSRLTWFAAPSLLFLIYAGASAAWAVDEWGSFLALLRVAALFAMGHVLLALADTLSRPLPAMGRALWIATAAACAIMVSETLAGGLAVPLLRGTGPALPEYLFNHAAAILSVAGWPAVLLVRARAGIWRAVLLGVAIMATVAVSGSDSALVALVIGIGFLPVFLWGGRPARRIGMVLVAGILLAMPVVVSQMANRPAIADAIAAASFSAKHRLVIWDYAAGKIALRPVFGWGFESSRRIEARDAGAGAKDGAKMSRLPLHPHNGPLQVWLELGLVGALFLVYFVARLFIAVERLPVDEVAKAVLCATIVTACTVASLTYGIWQNWWVASFWIVGALVYAATPLMGGAPPRKAA